MVRIHVIDLNVQSILTANLDLGHVTLYLKTHYQTVLSSGTTYRMSHLFYQHLFRASPRLQGRHNRDVPQHSFELL